MELLVGCVCDRWVLGCIVGKALEFSGTQIDCRAFWCLGRRREQCAFYSAV